MKTLQDRRQINTGTIDLVSLHSVDRNDTIWSAGDFTVVVSMEVESIDGWA